MTDVVNQEQAGPTHSFTLNDLVFLLRIVDTASQRGAFKADELSAVGGTYDRVVEFLKANGAIKTQEAPTEPATQN